MSHADGLAMLPDGTTFYFEYNGTVDICCTRLYSDCEEMHHPGNWRGDNMRKCNCEVKKHEKVILSTSYGHWDFLFFSEICQKCMAITGKWHDNDY